MAKKKYDWDAIEKDYRTGRYSNRQLSEIHGPTEGAIRARAKKYAWQKDLKGEINARIATELQRGEVTENENPEDEEIIKKCVATGIEIIGQHRSDASNLRILISTVQDKLGQQLGNGRTIENRTGDAEHIDTDLEYAAKVINHLTGSFERLVRIETTAYGLYGEEKPEKPEEKLTKEELENEIRRLLTSESSG